MNKNYTVYYFQPDNPQLLELWLEELLIKDCLVLICGSGGYWIFEKTSLLDTSPKVGSFAVDAMESYGEFYDKAVVALGFSSATLPSEEADDMMLKRVSDLFLIVRNLTDALKATYSKLPSHWRDSLPFSFAELMNRSKDFV